MKSLELIFHTIRQVLSGKQLIDNSSKYRIMCLAAAFIHLIFCIVMGVIGANVLCYYNVFVVYLYCFMGIILTNRKKFRLIMVMFFVEVELHSTLASLLLGWEWGFMLYTIALIPAAFYLANSLANRSKHIAYAISLSAFVIVVYFVASLIQPHVKPLYDWIDNPVAKEGMRFFNILIAFLLQLAFSALFALETKYMEQLLEKENVKLGIEASYDPLTRLLNRRSMTRFMSDELELSNDTPQKCCLVMLDIDDFKHINDTYGHDIGDKVLITLADLLTQEVRGGDYTCRWGGEEFLLLIHGDKQETYFVADRIRRKLEETVMKNKYDGSFSVTATFGVAEYKDFMPLRTIIDEADEKLYYGKNHGKNQVVM